MFQYFGIISPAMRENPVESFFVRKKAILARLSLEGRDLVEFLSTHFPYARFSFMVHILARRSLA